MARARAPRVFLLQNAAKEFRLNPFTGGVLCFTSEAEAKTLSTTEYSVVEFKLTKPEN